MSSTVDHEAICTQCGACCAAFRVSFYWSETENLPSALTEQLNPWLSCMKGTNAAAPHCQALSGTVGSNVKCSIYMQRPSPCREVQIGDTQCHKARARYALTEVITDANLE